MNIIPALPAFLILQCKYSRHEDAGLELFQRIGHFEPTFIEAYHTSKMKCKVRLLNTWTKTHAFLEEITSLRK